MNDKKEIDILVGANIKREREKAGYTQERFSELIGIGPKSLSAAERGVVGVSLSTLLKICQVLSISSDVLLFAESQSNAVQGLAQQLQRLTPEQFEIAENIIYNVLKAFPSQQ